MSGSDVTSSVYLTDTPKQIKTKINKSVLLSNTFTFYSTGPEFFWRLSVDRLGSPKTKY